MSCFPEQPDADQQGRDDAIIDNRSSWMVHVDHEPGEEVEKVITEGRTAKKVAIGDPARPAASVDAVELNAEPFLLVIFEKESV